jgi:hypothetical protein
MNAEDSLHSHTPVSALLQLLNSPQLLSWTTELTRRSHVSSFYNFGKNRIEITTSNSSSIIAAETCLASRCLVIDVSAVLLWVHACGVQASCHIRYEGRRIICKGKVVPVLN